MTRYKISLLWAWEVTYTRTWERRHLISAFVSNSESLAARSSKSEQLRDFKRAARQVHAQHKIGK